MMSVGHRPVIATQNGGPSQRPSKLMLLQADFQKKLVQEREEKISQQIEKQRKLQEQTITRYQHTDTRDRNDTFSAPGGVRSFFQERRKQLNKSHSATHISPAPSTKKKEGYDKSRPLEPIKRNIRNQGNNYTEETSPDPHQSNGEMSDFQRWQMEQNRLDKQRREKARGDQYSHRTRAVATYDATEDDMADQLEMMNLQHGAGTHNVPRQEAPVDRKALLKQKQEEQRRQQAEMGRRRREEAERKQKENAARLKRQQQQYADHDSPAPSSHSRLEQEKLAQLERQLQAKKRELQRMQRATPPQSPENDYYQTTTRQPSARSNRTATAASDVPDFVFNKPKRVTRKEPASSSRLEVGPNYPSQPLNASASPLKTQKKKPSSAKRQPPALNQTYKISREDDSPIPSAYNNQNTAGYSAYPTEYDDAADAGSSDLVPCLNCGRRFASDRIDKHQKACKKVSKPRKQFNMTAQRVAGTGAEEFVGKTKKAAGASKLARNDRPIVAAGKKDWRAQHREFIQAIRYAKKVSAVEAQGGTIADLPPPPRSENPDYIQCPHCSRRFNQTAAERHIPKCKDIIAKPKMLKKGTGTRR